ncbi:MAG TPA: hypothetical protein VN688_25775 [Gemmataceae bacterium]|nr:hypothetical protein [Gemmataceae bacterium]
MSLRCHSLMEENLTFAQAWLDFVPPDPAHYLESFIHCYRRGARSVRIEPANPTSISVARLIADTYGVGVRVNSPTTPADCLILLDTDADILSARLHALIDSPCQIVAPITSRYYQNQSYFLLTMPKAGTHLLYELMRSFHIDDGGPAPPTRAGHYHSLVHGHTHTTAIRFFEELANYPRGGADHPFFAHPALFIYRNPMDVVVSETFYLTRKEKTPLAHYYTTFSDHERCQSLIAADPIIGCIRDRVRAYVAWPRLANVIPVSFEELIGRKGGGSDEVQQRTIWSLQLKLHVSGSPREHGEKLFNPGSWTFRQGTINSHREFFRAEHYEAFRCLNQDFMRELGYDMEDSFEAGYLPRFVEAYRHRPLQLQTASS